MEHVVVYTKSGFSLEPTIGGGVERHVSLGLVDQEGHSITCFNDGQPPPDILEEILHKDSRLGESCGEPLGGQTTVKEEAAGKDDLRAIQEFATEDRKLVL